MFQNFLLGFIGLPFLIGFLIAGLILIGTIANGLNNHDFNAYMMIGFIALCFACGILSALFL